ncbi:hypothetical protein B0H12DRAFT_1268169 [Mycena haematopus]|nr:hypothetical protein B0H12DRAFT_1268169 [Mycena haematopus]
MVIAVHCPGELQRQRDEQQQAVGESLVTPTVKDVRVKPHNKSGFNKQPGIRAPRRIGMVAGSTRGSRHPALGLQWIGSTLCSRFFINALTTTSMATKNGSYVTPYIQGFLRNWHGTRRITRQTQSNGSVPANTTNTVDSGMPASDGYQDFGSSDDMDFVAAMFSDLPLSSPPQEWPLTLPPVPKPSPAVAPEPDTPPAPTRRRKRDEVDPNDIILERRARKVRVQES